MCMDYLADVNGIYKHKAVYYVFLSYVPKYSQPVINVHRT